MLAARRDRLESSRRLPSRVVLAVVYASVYATAPAAGAGAGGRRRRRRRPRRASSESITGYAVADSETAVGPALSVAVAQRVISHCRGPGAAPRPYRGRHVAMASHLSASAGAFHGMRRGMAEDRWGYWGRRARGQKRRSAAEAYTNRARPPYAEISPSRTRSTRVSARRMLAPIRGSEECDGYQCAYEQY